MDASWFYAVWTIGSYLLGSALVGDLVCRAKGIDIRKLGTGNPGTANIWRQVGPKYGIAVFVLDILKGVIVTLPLRLLDIEIEWIAISMFCMLCGQFFPIFFKFQGNTGMAALFGTAAGLIPLPHSSRYELKCSSLAVPTICRLPLTIAPASGRVI